MTKIKPSSAKAKGRKFQQYCRDKILELLRPYGIVQDDVKSTGMGQSGEDLQFSPAARKYLPISVECKSLKAIAVYKLYEQAEQYKDKGEPVLFIKADRKKPLAVVDLEYYLKLEEERLFHEN
jgi:hypothetical protein